jgi:Neprosin
VENVTTVGRKNRLTAGTAGTAICLVILGLPGCGNDDGNGSPGAQNPSGEQVGALTTQLVQSAPAARSAQVAAWVAQNHRAQGHRIVRTDTLDDGSIVDWVDAKTVPGSNAVPPPPLPSGKSVFAQAMPRELSGPPGALPFIRPAFSSFVDGQISAVDVNDYVRKISEERSAHGGPSSGNPRASNNRLFAPDLRAATNFGLSGSVNNFWTGITSPQSPDFSFYELAAYCLSGNAAFDLVGIIEGVNPQIYGTSTVWGAEFFQSGFQSWVFGGSNFAIWHQFSTSLAPGTALTRPSTIGGAQTQLQEAVILFNAASGATPGWWVSIANQWVGYFDSTVLTTLNTSACNSEWYGEAFDPDQATTNWMTATMGSGLLPNGSVFNNNIFLVGFVRQPTYYTAVNSSGGTFWSTLSVPGGVDTNCYNVTLSTDGNSQYNPTIFFGGPGGTSASCR